MQFKGHFKISGHWMLHFDQSESSIPESHGIRQNGSQPIQNLKPFTLFSVFTTSHQQMSGLYVKSVSAVVMWLCIILIRYFCFRCWGRWLLRHSINTGSAASTSALKPVVKDCLTYQSFIWRWVRIILPLSLAPCCPAFRTSLKRSKYAA